MRTAFNDGLERLRVLKRRRERLVVRISDGRVDDRAHRVDA
ncbi:MAG TPA: hypothetical protein VNT22_03670 [Baekduia sp.]|nr:hypothetical protein [Baekduia sp.]